MMNALIDEYLQVTKNTIYFDKSTLEKKKNIVLEKIQKSLNGKTINEELKNVTDYTTMTEILYELSVKNPSLLLFLWGLYFSSKMVFNSNNEGYVYRALFLFELVMKKEQKCELLLSLAIANNNNTNSNKWALDTKAFFDMALLSNIYLGWQYELYPTFNILKRRAEKNARNYPKKKKKIIDYGKQANIIIIEYIELLLSANKENVPAWIE